MFIYLRSLFRFIEVSRPHQTNPKNQQHSPPFIRHRPLPLSNDNKKLVGVHLGPVTKLQRLLIFTKVVILVINSVRLQYSRSYENPMGIVFLDQDDLWVHIVYLYFGKRKEEQPFGRGSGIGGG